MSSGAANQIRWAAPNWRRALAAPEILLPLPEPSCRGCGTTLRAEKVVCDLGAQPLANALLSYDDLSRPEIHYPLRPVVCTKCLLVQLPQTPADETVFTDAYPFRSGQSAGWRAHCELLAAQCGERFSLDDSDVSVLEIGSNDGTMLRAFASRFPQAHLLGVEPCRAVAEEALRAGIATDVAFWGRAYAAGMVEAGYRADLVLATNVLAHVSDLQDFLEGVASVLSLTGAAVFEVPSVCETIRHGQFDQMYAEHHCYFSLHSLTQALSRAGLTLVGAEPVSIHGGSIRATAIPADVPRLALAVGSVLRLTMLDEERDAGYLSEEPYLAFGERVRQAKRNAWGALIDAVRHHPLRGAQKRIVGYGASAKAAVTLNYLGMGPEVLDCVVDTTPAKQGRWLPGSRIPILAPDDPRIGEPDIVVNLLWNWREESERNIRAAWPDAQILYLSEGGRE